jgi:hypothetical protein
MGLWILSLEKFKTHHLSKNICSCTVILLNVDSIYVNMSIGLYYYIVATFL